MQLTDLMDTADYHLNYISVTLPLSQGSHCHIACNSHRIATHSCVNHMRQWGAIWAHSFKWFKLHNICMKKVQAAFLFELEPDQMGVHTHVIHFKQTHCVLRAAFRVSETFNWHPQQIPWTQCNCYAEMGNAQESLNFLHQCESGCKVELNSLIQWFPKTITFKACCE